MSNNTLQAKLGFGDDDLKTPKHDEIMLWLDANIQYILSEEVGAPVDIWSTQWEYVVKTKSNFTVGFIDFIVQATNYDVFCFEVKSSIPSLGEVIRQIRLYQAHMNKCRFIVVCPDDRFASALESQGIGFIKYPKEAR